MNSIDMDEKRPLTVDQMIQYRVSLTPNDPILAYPSSGVNYVDYTVRQLDKFAHEAAKHYVASMPQRQSSSEKPAVVALLGLSDLDYIVTILAVIKLGHTVLFLSPRISKDAQLSLIQRTECHSIIVSEQLRPVAKSLQVDSPTLKVHNFADKSIYEIPAVSNDNSMMTEHLNLEEENHYVAWIIHSSGSTSLPRPVYLTHKALLNNWSAHNPDMKAFITAPLYHSHGVAAMFKSFYCGKQAHMYNANLPMTTGYLVETMRKHSFGIIHIVPYSLKLLGESEEGQDLLAAASIVMFGGSPCPDALGDQLVARGVNLVSHYGTTETGQLMSSDRPPGDKLWNYVRPSDKTRPFLQFEDRGHSLLEIVVLGGWQGKVVENRPDGSYATKDLFTKHPTMEAYKYFSRLDDTIVLINGEKANPLNIENAIRQQPSVKEAVVFGHSKPQLGLIIIPTTDVSESGREAYLDNLWPAIDNAQKDMPDYGQLSRDMITILSPDTDYPMTDKRTVIRQAFYKKFEPEIEAAYATIEENTGTQDMSPQDLKFFIQQETQNITGSELIDTTTDFFSLGMDSLQASMLRSSLVRTINLHGNTLGLNVVFDYPNVDALAEKIYSFQTNVELSDLSIEEEMNSYIEKYGTFDARAPVSTRRPEEQCILLTGASGSLGAHILASLIAQTNVKKIYCPVRATSLQSGKDRIYQSLKSRMVFQDLEETSLDKIEVLLGNFSKPDLGLTSETLERIANTLTSVIHCAWSVNFNLRLRSFEKDCIAGLRYLIDLCLLSSNGGQRPPATFNFCSSVSTAEETTSETIPESLPPSFSHARPTGYAQSKLVSEHICLKAVEVTGLTCRVLRVGQLIGDTQNGVWNANEAFPLMWQSAQTIGALPQIQETPRWLPVDIAAQTIIDIAQSSAAPSGVFNVTNPRTFHWTQDLLPYLRNSPIGNFEECPPREWIKRLRNSNPDPIANPPRKLLEFFVMRYGSEKPPRSPPYWETEKAQEYSDALRNAAVVDQAMVDLLVQYFIRNCW